MLDNLEFPQWNGSNLFPLCPLKKEWGGLLFTAEIIPDDDSKIDDVESLTDEDIQRFNRDDWRFVGVYVTATFQGSVIAQDSLWGLSLGLCPGKLGSDDSQYFNEVTKSLLREILSQIPGSLRQFIMDLQVPLTHFIGEVKQ